MNECLTTNRKSCYTAARVLRSRWQKFKYSNKGRVEGGDRDGVSIMFSLSGDYRHIRRQGSGWRSDAENAIKLEKKDAGRSGRFPPSAFRHAVLPLYLLVLLHQIVQRCRVYVQIRAAPPVIKINIRRLHQLILVPPWLSLLTPSSAYQVEKETARTSAEEVAVAWLHLPSTQMVEFTATARWNQRICLESFW